MHDFEVVVVLNATAPLWVSALLLGSMGLCYLIQGALLHGPYFLYNFVSL